MKISKIIKSNQYLLNEKLILMIFIVMSIFFFSSVMLYLPAIAKKSNNLSLKRIASLWQMDLFRAAREKDTKTLKIMLENGGDPNARDLKNVPLLSYAAISGQPENVELVIKYGANVNDVYDGDNRTVLGESALRGLDSVIKILLKNGANPDKGARGKTNGTPLMSAASGGHFTTVVLLIDSGANISTKDIFGKSAIDYAASSKDDNNVLELLLEEAVEYKKIYQDQRPKSIEEIRENLAKIILLFR